jgi:hypothetical protein
MSEKQKLPVPKRSAGDVVHAIVKGGLSTIQTYGGAAAELFAVILPPPLEKRREDWMESVSERLDKAEANIESLGLNPSFVTIVVHATSIAVRTHQEEKLEALRNAVVNSAVGPAPSDDLQAIFVNLVDSFTPTHLRILKYFQNRSSFNSSDVLALREARMITDMVINEMAGRGLIEDHRPYAARGRDSGESLIIYEWTLSTLGKQFMEFITRRA